jgi:hypothetical protein
MKYFLVFLLITLIFCESNKRLIKFNEKEEPVYMTEEEINNLSNGNFFKKLIKR